MLDAEALERGVAGLEDILGPAVDAEAGPVRPALVAELGRQHDLVAPTGDGAADEFLVGERAVHVGRIEEVMPRSSARWIVAIDSSSSPGP